MDIILGYLQDAACLDEESPRVVFLNYANLQLERWENAKAKAAYAERRDFLLCLQILM